MRTRFHIDYMAVRDDPDVYLNWGDAQRAEIIAETVDGAYRRLRAMLPELRYGRRWVMRVMKIKDEDGLTNSEPRLLGALEAAMAYLGDTICEPIAGHTEEAAAAYQRLRDLNPEMLIAEARNQRSNDR